MSDLCDCVPLTAYRKLVWAEHAQFDAPNDALAVFRNLLSYFFDLRFQGRAVVANVLGERGQTLSSPISTITRGFPQAISRNRNARFHRNLRERGGWRPAPDYLLVS